MSIRWLLGAAIAGAAALALAQQPPPAKAPPGTPPPTQMPPKGPAGAEEVPDGFIEFLGSDDVSDPSLWEFLKRGHPKGNPPPPMPPQDRKQ